MTKEDAAELILKGPIWTDCAGCVGRGGNTWESIRCVTCLGDGVIMIDEMKKAFDILGTPIPNKPFSVFNRLQVIMEDLKGVFTLKSARFIEASEDDKDI